MPGVARHIDEERTLFILLDKPHGPLGEGVRHVIGNLNGAVVLEQIRIAALVGVVVRVGEAALESKESIESVGAWTKLRLVSVRPRSLPRMEAAPV